ncbi:MAG: hypothetical protein C0630_16555 [Sedimenticola selenatireducens]|uniref:Uncharacterized protein n=1 Tax=Sedimenticola selenatireducens TaxID=191960 RepID=A0A2N6CSN4_9GAMM|nr:MAG: hypothetical protein C0630_16555 [Sedimenticola selenatireducens]
MAGLAAVIGGDMVGRLAGRRHAVMTAAAVAGHAGVIEHRAGPAVGDVAVITLVAAGNVVVALAHGGGGFGGFGGGSFGGGGAGGSW